MTLSGGILRARTWLVESEVRHSERSLADEVLSAALVVMPTLALLFVLLGSALAHSYMPDFKVFLGAGHAVLEGSNPYPPAHAAKLLARGHSFVYPAPAAVAMAPLAWMPYGVALAIWTSLVLASIPGALLLLGVRDWRFAMQPPSSLSGPSTRRSQDRSARCCCSGSQPCGDIGIVGSRRRRLRPGSYARSCSCGRCSSGWC